MNVIYIGGECSLIRPSLLGVLGGFLMGFLGGDFSLCSRLSFTVILPMQNLQARVPLTIESAHKKGAGSTKNSRDSPGQRLGVKFTAEQPKYIGIIEDCCCDYETVNQLNTDVLQPMLQDLVKTPFYRYFKVKLWCDCPFWPDDGMCRLRDCIVCECLESEFPEPFKKPLSQYNPVCQEGKPQAAVDRTLDTRALRGWTVTHNPWTSDDETDNAFF